MSEVNTWVIEGQQIIDCIKEITAILNKYSFPLCVELGLLEDLKQGRFHDGHTELKE